MTGRPLIRPCVNRPGQRFRRNGGDWRLGAEADGEFRHVTRLCAGGRAQSPDALLRRTRRCSGARPGKLRRHQQAQTGHQSRMMSPAKDGSLAGGRAGGAQGKLPLASRKPEPRRGLRSSRSVIRLPARSLAVQHSGGGANTSPMETGGNQRAAGALQRRFMPRQRLPPCPASCHPQDRIQLSLAGRSLAPPPAGPAAGQPRPAAA